MTIERRRHLRIAVPGAYAELLVGGANVGVLQIEDVSDSGVFCACPNPVIPARTPVQLRFIEESPPFTLDGTIAVAVRPGGPRSPGYGIEFTAPPADAVERIIGVVRTVRVAQVTRAPGAGDDVGLEPLVVFMTIPAGPGPAMARALAAFGVATLHTADARAAILSLHPRVRGVLVDLAVLAASDGVSLTHVRGAAPGAHVLVSVDRLPDAVTRATLLRQGADQLLIAPFEPFGVLAKLHGLAVRIPPGARPT